MSGLREQMNSNKENLEIPISELQSTAANLAGPGTSAKDTPTLSGKSILEGQPPTSPRCQQRTDSEIPRSVHECNTLGHKGFVSAVAISNPSRFIYTSGTRTVKIWDLCNPLPSCPRAEFQCIYSKTDGCIRSIKLTQDGGTLLVAGDPYVQTWDIAGCLPRSKGELLGGRQYRFTDVTVSSDSRLCFSCSLNGDIVVWDLHNQIYIRRFRGHLGPCTCIRISSDGTKLWTGGVDETVKCWDVVKGQFLKQFEFASMVHSLDLCPQDERLVVGLENRRVQVLHVSKPDRHYIYLHHLGVTKVRFATCGKWFISSGRDNSIYGTRTPSIFIGPPAIFHENLETPISELQSTAANLAGPSTSAKDTPTLSGKSIVEGQRAPPTFARCQQRTDSEIPRSVYECNTLGNKGFVSAVAISNPSRFIYTSGTRTVKIWDLCNPFPSCPRAEFHCIYSKTDGCLRSIKLTQDGGTLLVAGDPYVQTWDIAGCLPRRKGELLGGRQYGFTDVAVSSDARLCFSCSLNGDVIVWDLHNQIYIRRFRGHIGPSTCIRISSDGTKLWTGGADETVKCWDVVKGQFLKQFEFASMVHSLDLCPQDERLVVGLENRRVEVLHVSKPGRHYLCLHCLGVTKVRFATCGKWYISSGRDESLYGNRTPSIFMGPPTIFHYRGCSPIWNFDISVDGKFIVTCSDNATVLKVNY